MQIKISLLFFFCFFSIQSVFSQSIIKRSVQEKYNPDIGDWQFEEERNFVYENQELVADIHIEYYSYWLENERIRTFEEQNIYEDNKLKLNSTYKLTPFGETLISETEYFYQNDLLLKEVRTRTDIIDTAYVYIDQKVYSYDDSENLIGMEMSWVTEGVASFIQKISYQYDERNCLIEQFEESSNGNKKRLIFERDNDCSILSETIFQTGFFSPDEVREKERKKYLSRYESNHFIKVDSFFLPKFQGVDGAFVKWDFEQLVESEFDERGNLVRLVNDKADQPFSRQIFEYDNQNRLIHQENYTFFGGDDYVLTSVYDFTFTEIFDEDEFLTELQKEQQITFPGGQINRAENFFYDNFCDGTIAIERTTNSENFDNIRVSYEYLNGVDCDFENEKQPLEISPNPSSGIFKIKGDLLGGASTKIKILNFVGQLLFEIKVPEQSYTYDLDLSHLNNGNYVIFIENGDYYSTEKITVFK